ncbi:MAG TPA: PilN domain-containing protein [Thermodesulfobacteriota bacterium]|nr:PilN domain-containing protein [Thermodesulfobacteriota bacterium]
MKINLLPREKLKKKSPYFDQGVFAIALVCVAILVVIGIWFYLQGSAAALDRKILDTKNELQKLKKNEEKIAGLKKSTAILEQKVKVIDQLEENKSGPAKILASLAMGIVPGRMWLSTLKCQGSKIVLEGVAVDNETIAQFMTNLEDSPEVENVELQFAEETKIENYLFKKFSLTAIITTLKDLETIQEASARR